MKVHPVPGRRNITLRYDIASVLAQASLCRQKKLRRLPHIFAKVLELPLHSDADVLIVETPDSLIFTATADEIGGGVRADSVEIYPGVTKVVIRGNGVIDVSGTELELDLWRFRLPASMRPELATAAYEHGELVVTVPKGAAEEEEEDDGGALVEDVGVVAERMSQEQPQRSAEAVKYGDLFNVSGQLASQPVTPQDAAVYGQTIKGGPAAVLQSAAEFNQRRGATIAQADIGGYRIVTEAVGGQVVGQYGVPVEMERDESKSKSTAVVDDDAVTIGEALEATALSAGNKPVDKSDVAAIQAAEVRATGLGHLVPGGVGAEAQSAAAHNMQARRDEEKTTLADVLTDASDKLVGDKPVTREDAEGVIYAELRNKEDLSTNPGGVAAVVAAAARLNDHN